jgi:hypothetical protein
LGAVPRATGAPAERPVAAPGVDTVELAPNTNHAIAILPALTRAPVNPMMAIDEAAPSTTVADLCAQVEVEYASHMHASTV